MRSRSLLLMAGLLAALPRVAAAGTGQCAYLEVFKSGPRRSDAGRRTAESFSASKVVDLTFRASIQGDFRGPHVLAFRVFGPQGDLYQSIEVPVADPGAPARDRQLPGYPRPIRETKPVPASVAGASGVTVSTAFPVGGTIITQAGLYGDWRVETRIDGVAAPYCAPVQFRINP